MNSDCCQVSCIFLLACNHIIHIPVYLNRILLNQKKLCYGKESDIDVDASKSQESTPRSNGSKKPKLEGILEILKTIHEMLFNLVLLGPIGSWCELSTFSCGNRIRYTQLKFHLLFSSLLLSFLDLISQIFKSNGVLESQIQP